MYNVCFDNTPCEEGHRNMPYEILNSELESICLEHIEKDEALVFAFLLYDDSHYQIVDLLKNESYWNSLDKISRDFISVFSLNCTGIDSECINRIRRRKDNTPYGDSSEELPEESNVLNHLKLDTKLNLPAFCFFGIDKERNLTHCFVKPLKLRDTKQEIVEILSNAVEISSHITPENKFNGEQIIRNIESGMSDNFKDVIKKELIPLLLNKLISLLLS